MTTKQRPKVFSGAADKFASEGERIVEFTFPDGRGGLISLREVDGQPMVTLYRVDPEVKVVVCVSSPHPTRAQAEHEIVKS
jgi:hypothetical protein